MTVRDNDHLRELLGMPPRPPGGVLDAWKPLFAQIAAEEAAKDAEAEQSAVQELDR